MSERAKGIQEYVSRHKLSQGMNTALNFLCRLEPLRENPYDILPHVIREQFARTSTAPFLTRLEAYAVLDNAGNPTVEVLLWTDSSVDGKVLGKCNCTVKMSRTKGLIAALAEVINSTVSNALQSAKLRLDQQQELDTCIVSSGESANLPSRISLCISFCIANTHAFQVLSIPLYQHFRNLLTQKEQSPCSWDNTRPIVTVLEPPSLNLTVGVLPKMGMSFADSSFLCTAVAREAKDATAFLSLESIDACLDLVKTAAETAGAKLGEDIFLTISCNFPFTPNDNKYAISSDKSVLPSELVEIFKSLVDKYPTLRLLENPLPSSESAPLKEALPERIQLAFTNEPGDSAIIDVQDMSSLSEAFEIARKSINIIVVDRSEITNDTSFADLCAAFEGAYFKVNRPLTGSGLSLSRLIRIESQLKIFPKQREEEEEVEAVKVTNKAEPEVLP